MDCVGARLGGHRDFARLAELGEFIAPWCEPQRSTRRTGRRRRRVIAGRALHGDAIYGDFGLEGDRTRSEKLPWSSCTPGKVPMMFSGLVPLALARVFTGRFCTSVEEYVLLIEAVSVLTVLMASAETTTCCWTSPTTTQRPHAVAGGPPG